MTLTGIRQLILVVTIAVLAGGIGYRLGERNFIQAVKNSRGQWAVFSEAVFNRRPYGVQAPADFSQFWKVWDILAEKYYRAEELDPKTMVDGAINGLVVSLKDPWSVYLPANDNQRAKDDLNGQFEGIGIQLGFKNERLAVIAPLKGLAAEKAGIRAGDYVVHIKDEAKNLDVDTAGLSIYEAVDYIRGPRNTGVTLTIEREEGKQEITVVRETITVPSVELVFGRTEVDRWVADDTGGRIAWLKLNQFGDNTLSEWTVAAAKIANRYRQGEISGMVLDLRNNPGGYLSGAVSLASEFIAKGVIVKQENANGQTEEYPVNRQGSLFDIPVVVVANKGSASASEIMAGALRHYQRAKIVGETTFGKGTIQEAVELDNGAGLHVTTAKWLLPDGTWLANNQGLEPDVKVENPKDDETKDLQLITAVELVNNK